MSGAIRTVCFKRFFQNYIPLTRSMGLGAISNENRVKSFSEPVYKQPGSEVRQTPYRHFEAPPATTLDKSNSEILHSQIESNGFSRMLTFAMLYVGGTFFTIYLIRKDIITNLNDTFQNSFYLMNNKGNPGDGAGQGGRAEGEIIFYIIF